ncbi:MAG: phage terminase small subunit P27 family [Methanosphaera sp.]|nr:phage terminase small subunit P27 family [Methanosphaera sp.]
MSKNEYTSTTVKYLTNVRKYLKEKYGKVSPEWEQPLEILADNLELYQQCKESIKNDGLLLVAKNGAYTKNPLIKVQLDAQVQITKFLSEFGLTPKAQSKIVLNNDDEDDELRELLGD